MADEAPWLDTSSSALGWPLAIVVAAIGAAVAWRLRSKLRWADLAESFARADNDESDDPDLERTWSHLALFVIGLAGFLEAPVFVRPLVDALLGTALFGGIAIAGLGMLFPGLPVLGGVGEAKRFSGAVGGEKVVGVGVLARVTHHVSGMLASVAVGVAFTGFGVRAATVPDYVDVAGGGRWVVITVALALGFLLAVGGAIAVFAIGENARDQLVLCPQWFCFPWAKGEDPAKILWAEVADVRSVDVAESQAGGTALEAVDARGETLGRLVTTDLPHAERIERILVGLWRDPNRRERLDEASGAAGANHLGHAGAR